MPIVTRAAVLLALAALGSSLVSQPDFAGDANRIQNLQTDSLAARDAVPSGYVAPPYYPTPPGGVSFPLLAV